MDRWLRAELGRLLDEPCPFGRRVGIEQEFFVTRGGGVVDFGSIARAGRLPGKPLDRGDPHAHRMPWGGVITADGREAEIATPPATLLPGFTDRLGGWLARGRHELHGSLGAGFQVDGASTHLNVQVADDQARAIARRFVARHSLAMMLLLDRRHSPGLLVRPRRGRLELGGEFATGHQLVAASLFAAAATMDCQRRARRSTLDPFVVPARERFGYYVDRRAFGGDLYHTGRDTRVGRRTAQWNLERSWEIVRRRAVRIATASELAATDAVVRGDHPLPCELPDPDDMDHVGDVAGAVAPWGEDLTTHRRRLTFTVLAVIATWDHVVFELRHGGRSWIVALPAERVDRFLRGFVSGQLDDILRRLASSPDRAFPPLLAAGQIGGGGVFDSVGSDTTLQPLERTPGTGAIGGGGAGERADKHRGDSSGSSGSSGSAGERPPLPRGTRTWVRSAVPAGVAGVAVVVAGALVVALLARGGSEETAASPPVADASASASPTPAPAVTPTPTIPTTSSPGPPTSGPAGPTSIIALPLEPNDLAGTYNFAVTVVDGNTEVPVGSQSAFTAKVSVECDGDDCVVTFPGLGTSHVVDGTLRYVGTTLGPCPSDPSIQSPLDYDTSLEPVRGVHGSVSGFTGSQLLTAKVGDCPNAEVDPVRSEWVGTRA